MGKAVWAAYAPGDINWEARSRVEAWERHDRDIETRVEKPVSHTASGVAFAIVMAGIFAATWILFV